MSNTATTPTAIFVQAWFTLQGRVFDWLAPLQCFVAKQQYRLVGGAMGERDRET